MSNYESLGTVLKTLQRNNYKIKQKRQIMSMYECDKCGQWRDSDDGCAPSPDGSLDLVCPECFDELEEIKKGESKCK